MSEAQLGRSATARAAGVACLVGIATSHLVDLPEKVAEAPYVAVLFVALIGVSLVLAILLAIGWRLRLVWAVAACLSLATIACYVFSRTVGLPQLEDHVGMWVEPAGIASLCFEAAAVALGLHALSRRKPQPVRLVL